MVYTAEQLINNVCEHNNFRNSQKNHEKLVNCGLVDGEKIKLGGNYSVAFFACHDGIRKTFYWGNREVSRDTVIRRVIQK